MGLSHPPGWDNISPDGKIGGYACLKSENTQSGLPGSGVRYVMTGRFQTPGFKSTNLLYCESVYFSGIVPDDMKRNFQRDVTAWIGWQRSHHYHPRLTRQKRCFYSC